MKGKYHSSFFHRFLRKMGYFMLIVRAKTLSMKNFICLALIDSFDPLCSCQIDVILSYVPILAKQNEVDRSPNDQL